MHTHIPAAQRRLFELIRDKSFFRGEVTLSSGKVSDHYFDMKPVMFDPVGAKLLCELIWQRLRDVPFDLIGGLEMGAVPLIGPLVLTSGTYGRPTPGFFVRKTAKGHGTDKLIEGVKNLNDKRVVIVEDVTTTGASALAAAKHVQAAGASIAALLSIVDREEGAASLYQTSGIPFEALFHSSEFR